MNVVQFLVYSWRLCLNRPNLALVTHFNVVPNITDPIEKNRVIVSHGFRAAFTTWAKEREKNMMLVKCLAHKDPYDRHNGTYRRGTLIRQRKVLLQQWADFCFSQVQTHQYCD